MGFMRLLQGWIGVVGLVACLNTISCFMNHKILADKVYTDLPSEVNGLMARVFGVWTLLASVLRVWCAMDMSNKDVYNLTLFSFVLAFLHFASEIFIYKTAASFSMGVAIPFIISGGSAILMVVGQYKMNVEKAAENDKENEFLRFPRHKEAELFRMAKHKKAQ